MCIWKVNVKNRHCEYCSWHGGCEKRPLRPDISTCAEATRRYVEIMNEIVGRDVLERSREHMMVFGRAMIAYRLREECYSTTNIGKCLGMKHCTIIYISRMIAYMLEKPRQFREEMDIWNKFIEKISSEKDF